MNLFWRIWLWFWAAMILLGVTFFVAHWQHWQWTDREHHDAEILDLVGDAAMPLLRQDDPDAFNRWRKRIEYRTHGRLYVIGPNGREAGGRRLPPELRNFLHENEIDEPYRHRDWRRHEQIFVAPLDNGYRAVAVLDRHHGPFARLPGWANLLIAAVVSGFVCFALAYWLTKPVRRVREATMKLAEGDLSVRIGDAFGRRGDEVAQLARDFDGMAERLESSINAQHRLLRDVSHELRSPLTRLQVAIELARDESNLSPEQVERMIRENERLDELISQVLTLARFESGEQAPAFQRLDLADLARSVAEDADFEAQRTNRHVQLETPENAWTHGDERLLRSAIENIVRNAVRYTAEGTTVEVMLSGQNGGWEIRVQDQGPGVPEEDLERIFEPFVRVGEARDRDSGGHGIGLAITRRAVSLHGGSIAATNTDSGLSIHIHLPARG